VQLRSQDSREKTRTAAADTSIDTTPASFIFKVDEQELLWLRSEEDAALAFGSCGPRQINPHSKALASRIRKKLQRPFMLPKG